MNNERDSGEYLSAGHTPASAARGMRKWGFYDFEAPSRPMVAQARTVNETGMQVMMRAYWIEPVASPKAETPAPATLVERKGGARVEVGNIQPPSRITRPTEGEWILRLTRKIFGAHSRRVLRVEQAYADMRHELHEARSAGDDSAVRWVLVRGICSLARSIGFWDLLNLVSRIYEMLHRII